MTHEHRFHGRFPSVDSDFILCYDIREPHREREVASMQEWNQDFHNISVRCRNQVVQIRTDQALVDFLENPQTKGSLLLSDYVLSLYKKEIGRPLKITRDSLAIEILAHVYVSAFARLAENTKSSALQTAVQKLKKHTGIIDCGELDVDTNRHIWDALDKSPLKNMIYFMCGKNA